MSARTFPHRDRIPAAVLFALALLLLAACGTTATVAGSTGSTGSSAGAAPPPSPPTTDSASNVPAVRLTASEAGDMFTFDGPTTAPAGPLLVSLTNKGTLEHEAGLAKLKDGVTDEQLEAAFNGPNPAVALGMVDFAGGPNGVAPGTTGTVIVDPAPGDYEVYCFIPAPDGKPHVAHGMFHRLTITAPATPAKSTTPPVTVAGTITMRDFSVILPDDFTGKGWYHVVNEGKQPHEAVAYRLMPGKTVEDFTAWQRAASNPPAADAPPPGPPPTSPVGGVAPAAPGVDQWVNLDLDPGQHHVFVCFIPDPTKGFTPHWMEGMLTPWPTNR